MKEFLNPRATRPLSGLSVWIAATLAVVMAVCLRWALHPILGESLPLVTLFGAVAVAVRVGGVWPAFAAALGGYMACATLFMNTGWEFGLNNLKNWVGLLAYLLTCGVIIGFGLGLRNAYRRAELGRRTLQVTLASMGDAVIVTDAAGTVTFLNAAAEEITGWSSPEAVGQPLPAVFRIVNEETRKPVENPAELALRKGVIVGLANHTVLIRKSLDERPIDDSAAPIRDQTGEIKGCVLIFHDISGRRRLERQVAEQLAAARFLAAIIVSSQDAIISKSLSGHIQSWNAAAERLFGYRADEVLGRHITLLIPPDRIAEEDHIIGRLKAGESIEHFDTLRLRKDRTPVEVSLTISPIRNEQGTVIGASKIVRDISDRVQTEAILKRQNERLALLSEAAAGLLSVADADEMLPGLLLKIGPYLGVDTYFNYMVDESGTELRLMSYQGVSELQASEIRTLQLGQAVCGRVALERRPEHLEDLQSQAPAYAEFVRKLGLTAYICQPLISDHRLLGTLSFGSRTRKRFDPHDLVFLETIANYVSTATERLRLLQKLRASDQRKDEFLATLAHELRNPLAPIGNMIEVIKQIPSGPTVAEAIGSIDRQFSHLVRLVDDLLDVSRITHKKLSLRVETVSIQDVLSTALETCREFARQNQLAIEVEMPRQPGFIKGDAVRLSQVFSNLLNNACKYSRPGGTVWVQTEISDREVTVRVKDNGIGITPGQLPVIFEMFTQAASDSESARAGLGIGLALARQLIEMHGGTISAASQGPEMGSEFQVSLPRTTGFPTATPSPRVSDLSDSPRRILVVDDNVDSASSLALLLRLAGHHLRMAHNGLDALELAASFLPNLVLLDIGLPQLSGLEVCRRMRAASWGQEVTLVALTGWGQESDRQKSLEAGFDFHLVKPIDLNELKQLIHNCRP